MKTKPTLSWLRSWLAALFLSITLGPLAAQAGELKFEALLVWATNAEKSPNPRHVPVDKEVRQKLRELPLKWKNYFEVNRQVFIVPSQGSEKAKLSQKCQIEVRDVDGTAVEVSLIGKGEPVLKRVQPLPKGEILVLGGNAPDETGWLVVLKRIE